MVIIFRHIICVLIALALKGTLGNVNRIEDGDFWNRDALDHLQKIVNEELVKKPVKNVVFFVGDGMGVSTITAGRIYKGQLAGQFGEEYKLNFEKFPYSAFSKTYNVESQVTDSAAGATALFSGVKANGHMLGFDSKAKYNHCDKEINAKSAIDSIAKWAQDSGKDTGFVTTTSVTHATPAALYAHSNNRGWECDEKIPFAYRNCIKDIARQLIEDEPGKNFKVLMGAGESYFCFNHKHCERKDGRNLIRQWKHNNPNGEVVHNLKDLMSVDLNKTDKIFGLFGHKHMDFQATKKPHVPSLANMTRQAIRLLKKNKDGFFLMVEGGKIDLAHHYNQAKLCLDEMVDFDNAVEIARQELNLEESLIIVTADHSHTMTINGYSKRGANILGLNKDNSYEILSYANGPSFDYHRAYNHKNTDDGTWKKLKFFIKERLQPNYKYFSPRSARVETHGGEDVAVYADGAYSHLFRGTVEQNYIPHAVAYAACYKNRHSHCQNNLLNK